MQYLYQLYYAILILGSNELGPVNPSEMLGVTLLLVFSSIFNSQVFGEIAMIVSELQKKDTAY